MSLHVGSILERMVCLPIEEDHGPSGLAGGPQNGGRPVKLMGAGGVSWEDVGSGRIDVSKDQYTVGEH